MARQRKTSVRRNAGPKQAVVGTSEFVPPEPTAVPLSGWQIGGVAVTGLAHFRKRQPCQDAVAWRNSSRPILALSDGAGSSAISERGANALVYGMSRFLVSLEDVLLPWLDAPAEQVLELSDIWAKRLLAHARGILEDLAQSERRSTCDVRATLLMAVVGATRIFWWQVGDGAIVAKHADGLRVVSQPCRAKGEFSNQTCFADAASMADVQFGLLPTADILGMAMMSDGGAERLVANDGSRVALRVDEWLDAITHERLSPDKIALAFHEQAMWERTSLDDRSIVLMARARECLAPHVKVTSGMVAPS